MLKIMGKKYLQLNAENFSLDKPVSEGIFFSPILTQMMDSFFLPLNFAFLIQKNLPEVPYYAEM